MKKNSVKKYAPGGTTGQGIIPVKTATAKMGDAIAGASRSKEAVSKPAGSKPSSQPGKLMKKGGAVKRKK